MFLRDLEQPILKSAQKAPVLALFGPRQSGKTTLVKKAFPDHAYTNLENLNQRDLAQRDPPFFLKSYKKGEGIIIDEVQHAPDLLSYIQLEADNGALPGSFILTGSQNLLMNQQISQTLAGRVAIFDLLPCSMHELIEAKLLSEDLDISLFKGGYPRVFAQDLPPDEWYNDYIRTYLERDVRQIRSVSDLASFQRFLKLCAGRIGQLINFSDLGRDCGISYHTVQSWLSILEASFVIFLLQPYHKNFNKRVTKSPKLYFHDTGIACSLLQLEHSDQLKSHYLRGNLFENYIISDLLKQRFNKGKRANCYFWRDHQGREVDCIIESGGKIIPLEIKSGSVIAKDFFDNLNFFCEIAEVDSKDSYLIYGGLENQLRRERNVLGWRSASELIFKSS